MQSLQINKNRYQAPTSKTKVKILMKTLYNMGGMEVVLQQQNGDSLESGDAKLTNKQESSPNNHSKKHITDHIIRCAVGR